ncbi:bifunctional ADP-heptose synthase [uncultured Cytophaga sp.]|mgnify:CR=1 FL=1|uniref:bifunctional heptose 7-phosphate kinase/heptose 1-phosphate adenyltransferase n=1 Tax=uncultured Cytophaga sp. TaxID=160238 RepID=UPI0026062154|nr:bifunctional ADP-heptose synthase [uncultured Cytophaga sp.]
MLSKTKVIEYHTAEDLFKVFRTFNVLIIGDVMIDSYLWGKVDRISPEAPVPILQVEKREIRPGGAANVALNIKSLGATPLLCGLVGDDADGTNFLKILQDNNLPTEGIVSSKDRVTTIKHRIISNAHHMLRVDQEDDKVTNSNELNALKTRIDSLLEKAHVIIFEDYDKGVLSEELIKYVTDKANTKGIPTVVDPKKRNFLQYKNCSLFKPNRKELKEGVKTDSNLNDSKQLEQTVEELMRLLTCDSVLITLSEKGVYWTNKSEHLHIPAHHREIADVSGAGDTVISVAALCAAAYTKPSILAALSNLSGGLVCEQVGVVPIDQKLLQTEAEKLGIVS